MLRLLLLAILLAMTPLARGQDAAAPDAPPQFGVTVTCSAAIPSVTVGCFAERPVIVLGPLEVAVGVDAQAVLTGLEDSHLAPYAVAAWYAGSWSAWVELRLPHLDGVPAFGDADWLRVGLTTRF